MRRARSWLFWSLFLLPIPAAAQGRDGASAEALFIDGREALARGDFGVACTKFEESLRLDPAPGTLLNLADCEERTGKLARAWQHLRRVLDVLDPADDRVQYAARRLRALEPRVPRLTIRLAPGAPADTGVHRDNIALGEGSLGVPLPLDPGAHVVDVTLPGRSVHTYAVTVAAGDSKELVVEPLPENAPPPANRAADPAPRPHPRRTWGFAVAGVGLAAAAFGATTGILALARARTYREHCDANDACDPSGLDAASSAKTFSTLSTVGFAVGAVGLVAGATLLWTSRNPAAPKTVSLGVSGIQGGGGVACVTTF